MLTLILSSFALFIHSVKSGYGVELSSFYEGHNFQRDQFKSEMQKMSEWKRNQRPLFNSQVNDGKYFTKDSQKYIAAISGYCNFDLMANYFLGKEHWKRFLGMLGYDQSIYRSNHWINDALQYNPSKYDKPEWLYLQTTLIKELIEATDNLYLQKKYDYPQRDLSQRLLYRGAVMKNEHVENLVNITVGERIPGELLGNAFVSASERQSVAKTFCLNIQMVDRKKYKPVMFVIYGKQFAVDIQDFYNRYYPVTHGYYGEWLFLQNTRFMVHKPPELRKMHIGETAFAPPPAPEKEIPTDVHMFHVKPEGVFNEKTNQVGVV